MTAQGASEANPPTRPAPGAKSPVTGPAQAGARRVLDAPALPMLPVLLLLVSDVYRNLTLIAGMEQTAAQILSYVLWLVGTMYIFSLLRADSRFKIENVAIAKVGLLFVAAFAASTFAVWLSGRRSDIDQLIIQSSVLLYMSIPLFALNFAAKFRNLQRPIMAVCHAIFILSVISIVSDYLGLSIHISGPNRFFGFMGDPVAWALTLPLVTYFAAQRILLSALCGAALALTASRAPALMCIVALLVLMLLGRGRRLHYVLILSLLFLLAVYGSPLFTALLGRLGATDVTSNDRLSTAKLGLKLFNDSRIFGLGYNSLSHFYPATAAGIARGALTSQTSTFVQMLSDGGLVLFLPYLGFVLACTANAIALMRRSQELAEGALIRGMCAWLIAMLWVNQSALWFVVGSYIAPLVFGTAGIIAGTLARLRATSVAAAYRPEAPLSQILKPAA